MNDILQLARIQIAVIVAFIVNKVFIRPFILEGDFSSGLNIFVLSFSNFCEAIIGTLSTTMILLYIHSRWFQPKKQISETLIYLSATILAGVYVILQEFKIHNLGGQNVYDPYDVLFSLIGLIVSLILLIILKPKIVSD